MALYDDASFIFLASGAARTDTAQGIADTTGSTSGGIFSKAQCIKPVEALDSTELLQNNNFSIDGGGTGGALEENVYGTWGWNHTDAQGTDASSKITGGVLTLSNGTDGDSFAYATTSSNNRNILTENATFKLTYTITASKITAPTDDHSFLGYWDGNYKDIPQTVGTHSVIMVHGTSGSNELFLFRLKGNNDEVSIDNVSIKKVTTVPLSFDMTRDANLDATRVGPTGLIEKGRENLILQSNGLNNSPWTPSGDSTVTTGQSGYDGSSNAFLISKVSEQFGGVNQDVTASNVHTFSAHLKAGSVNFVRLFTGPANVFFDLSGSGSIGATSGTKVDATLTSIGNGWFRCTVTVSGSISVVKINPAIGDNDLGTTGDGDNGTGTGSIFVQDCQLEAGLVATDVIATTSAAGTAGIKEDEPRFDYPLAGGAPSLLIEPERKNELPKSEYFPDSQGTRVTVTVNTTETLSPEGVHNAVKMMDEATGDANHTHVIESLETASSLDNSTVYTVSAFVKDNGRDAALNLADSTGLSNRAAFNLSGSGSVITTGAFDSASIEDYGNGWFRIIATGTTDSSAGATKVFLRNLDRSSANDADYLGDATKGIYFYGVQLEKGANATSYIPCHGAAATRSADTLPEIDLNANGITLGTSVTVFLEASKFNADSQTSFLQLRTGTDSNNRFLFFSNTSAVGATHDINIQHRQSGTAVPKGKSGLTRGDFFKCIGRVDGTTFTMFINGEMLTPATIVATDVFDKISLIRNGDVTNQSGHKNKSVVVWASALTNQQCIDLTKP